MKFIGTIIFFYLSLANTLLGQQKIIEVAYEKINHRYHFSAINHSNVPYYLKFQFSELKNLESNQVIADHTPTIYPNKEKRDVLILSIKDTAKSSSFNFNYLYTIGEPRVAVDRDFLYWLPYKHGKRIRIGQGYNGQGTHSGINAIDFNIAIGDTIYAARGGFVYEIKEDSNKGGNSLSYEKDGNYIYVYHSDGTLGKYVHLKQDGAIVSIGDTISIGQAIGLSGNTGYSSGPHLHFTVVHNEQFITKTLPVSFLNYRNEGFIPTENNTYYGFHPGKPAFEVKDKETFDESKLENKRLKATLSNKVEIESEPFGDYTLFYVNNGLAHAIQGKLTFELEQMVATKKIPYEFRVEGNSKQYLLAITPKDKAEHFSYKLSASFWNSNQRIKE